MKHLTVPIGHTISENLTNLQQIKDALTMAILNHPAVTDALKTDANAQQMQLMYLEAVHQYNQINNDASQPLFSMKEVYERLQPQEIK